ncbi:MAG: sodium:solute symporter [Armatimonadetes bacterium]|nr:sodium:solute symporter [Armatimonadota bacterium]
MGSFSPLDYAVFAIYLMASVLVGVWFVREQRTVKDYFLAGQSMNWFVVAISVIAALFSGISYLGAPTEVFNHDLTYAVTLLSFFVATPVVIFVFLPFFYRLKLYSAYEYLEKRFDVQVRTWSSAMFIIRVIFYLALAIYAPALAVASVTGLPLWFSIIAIGLLTTIYTTLGGMKAVIWTDVMQFFILFGGQIAIAWVAISRVPGGWHGTFDIALSAGKLNFANFDWSLTARVTFWGALIGGLFNALVQMGTDQISVQRYLTAKSLAEAKKSLWFKLIVTVPVVMVFYLMGAILFSFYQVHPDRLPELEQADRLVPYFVVNELPAGVPGLLIAAIFAATMSTVSSGINALSTASVVDFYRRHMNTQPEPDHLLRLSKTLTACYGVLATLAAFLMPLLGTLVEATNKIMGMLGGPLLGVFLLGMLSRRANGPGTLLGAFFGSLGLAYVVFSTQVSFLWYAVIGCLLTMGLGYVFSLVTGTPTGDKIAGLVYRPGVISDAPVAQEQSRS